MLYQVICKVFSGFRLTVTTKLFSTMILSQPFLEDDDISQHDAWSLPVSQARNNPQDESHNGDHLCDENEEDDAYVDYQGYDMDAVPFIQYQGLPAHLQSERVLTDPGFRCGRILDVTKTHLGLKFMLRIDRKSLFWPKIGNDLKEIYKRCEGCRTNQNDKTEK